MRVLCSPTNDLLYFNIHRPECPCGSEKENITHFLFDCHLYAAAGNAFMLSVQRLEILHIAYCIGTAVKARRQIGLFATQFKFLLVAHKRFNF